MVPIWEGERPVTRFVFRAFWIALFACLLIPAAAAAQAHAGVRAGASGEPGQFFFGGHVETKPLAEHLTFRPNVEVGLGDSVTVVAFNLEFAWWVPTRNPHPWRLYVGGGPAAIVWADGNGPEGADDNVGGGVNLLVGGQHRGGLFGEFKVGLIDSPEIKVTVGYAFK